MKEYVQNIVLSNLKTTKSKVLRSWLQNPQLCIPLFTVLKGLTGDMQKIQFFRRLIEVEGIKVILMYCNIKLF